MVDLWPGGSLGICLLVETHYYIFKKALSVPMEYNQDFMEGLSDSIIIILFCITYSKFSKYIYT